MGLLSFFRGHGYQAYDGEEVKKDEGEGEKLPLVTLNTNLVSGQGEVVINHGATQTEERMTAEVVSPQTFGVPAPTPSVEDELRAQLQKIQAEHEYLCSQVIRLLPGEIHQAVGSGVPLVKAVENFIKSRT